MNYYAQGGQAHGLKSIAQELQDMGRGGDTILAHINPQEAALLKRMGGSGTINPATGLPEFLKIKALKPIERPFRSSGVIGGALKPIIEPIRDIIQDLGPVATIAATYFGGPLGAGIVGGLSGQKGFDFKRALLSGALAYGAQNLAQGVSASSDAALSTAADVAAPSVTDVAATLGTDAATGYGSQAAMLAEQAAGFGDAGLANIASSGAYGAGSAANLVGAAADTTAGMADAYAAGNQSIYDKGIQSLTDVGSKLGTDVKNFGSGVYNLATGQPGAAEAFKASGATMTNTALPIFMGYSGIEGMDEAEKMKNEADLANAKSQAEYDEIMARIEASKQRGVEAMKRSPYMFAEGGEVPSFGGNIRNIIDKLKAVQPQDSQALPQPGQPLPQITLGGDIRSMIDKLKNIQPQETDAAQGLRALGLGLKLSDITPNIIKTLDKGTSNQQTQPKDYELRFIEAAKANPYQFAYGGPVDDEPGLDDWNNYAGGGIGMAAGGTPPRFLSGGGDGMSDDIKATINGKHPARLADGEFVIPADVVSHLGNGSSKAGAKKLYSMMDKVRVARTGNKEQGKKINPNKFLLA